MTRHFAIPFCIGIFIPLLWHFSSRDSAESGEARENHSDLFSPSQPHESRRSHSHADVDRLQLTLRAIKHNLVETTPEPWELRQLQRLIFTLSENEVSDLLVYLQEHPDIPERDFLLRTLFARWAEIDPYSANFEALALGEENLEPLRGALVTWLTIDEAAAITWLQKNKPPHPQLLSEWIKNYDANRLADAAQAIETLHAFWTEGSDHLFKDLAERWVMTDWQAASEWVSQLEYKNKRDTLLSRIARLRGEFHGFDALEIAALIEDDATLRHTQKKIYFWWPFESAPKALSEISDRGGFPTDWEGGNMYYFGKGMVGQHPGQLSRAISLCQNDTQLSALCHGVLANTTLGHPEQLTAAAIAIPDSAFSDPDHGANTTKTFLNYYKRLREAEPHKAMTLGFEFSDTKKNLISDL